MCDTLRKPEYKVIDEYAKEHFFKIEYKIGTVHEERVIEDLATLEKSIAEGKILAMDSSMRYSLNKIIQESVLKELDIDSTKYDHCQ